MTGTMKIATSRFQNGEVIIETGLAPVRITLGHPRWKLPYELAGTVLDFAPDREWVNVEDDEEFTRRMVAKLFTVGAPRAREILDEMATGYSGVVLLCYEQLPGDEICHRTVVAEWLTTALNIPVEELEDRSPPPRNRSRRAKTLAAAGDGEQSALFEMPAGEASKRVVDKATMLVTSGKVHRGIGGAYMVEASSGPHGYNVTVDPPRCDCKWGRSSNPSACSHLLAARYVDQHREPEASNG